MKGVIVEKGEVGRKKHLGVPMYQILFTTGSRHLLRSHHSPRSRYFVYKDPKAQRDVPIV